MIKRPTVMVLGAGASAPYGFPLGTALTDGIRHELQRADGSGFRNDLTSAGGGTESKLREFGQLLGEAGRYSIDEFLQWHPEYRDVGKLAIARMLIPGERDDRLDFTADGRLWLQPPDVETRWYRYLFDQLLTSAKGRCGIALNRLTVLTFNFDRSFERALFRFILANCARDHAEAREMMKAIPILHLHGQLGLPEWLGLGEPSTQRAYSPDAAYLRAVAGQIRILDEEVLDSAALQDAVDALEAAEVVCFLGVSYHPLNLQKLQLAKFARKEVRGTAYQLPKGPRSAVERAFHQADSSGRSTSIMLAPPDEHILAFLQNTDLIYD